MERRIEAWDYLRFFAFVDIACLHLLGEHLLGGLGLPAFVIITCALALTSSARSFADLAHVRARRLFLPWLFWSIPLGAQIALAQLKQGAPVAEGFEPWMVFYGTGLHLWFLPYAAVAGLLVYALHHLLGSVSTERLLAGCMAVAGGLLMLQPYSEGMPLPFGNWLFASPGVPLGLALGRVLTRSSSREEIVRGWVILGLGLVVLVAAMLALGLGSHTDEVVWRYAAAFALLAAVSWLRIPSTRFMRTLRPLMFGAYVLHPAIGYQLMRFTRDKFTLMAMTISATLVTVMALRKTPLRAVL